MLESLGFGGELVAECAANKQYAAHDAVLSERKNLLRLVKRGIAGVPSLASHQIKRTGVDGASHLESRPRKEKRSGRLRLAINFGREKKEFRTEKREYNRSQASSCQQSCRRLY